MNLLIGNVISDVPPPTPSKKSAICRTPDELLKHRANYGNATYAVTILEETGDETWYFSNDLQEAVAIGLRWHDRNCALQQYPLEQDGQIVYGYRVQGSCDSWDIEEMLDHCGLFESAGADINEGATPEIMARVRIELFKFLSVHSPSFLMLDFSQPDGASTFLQDWADELE
ncbi:transposase [Paraburkholderia sp. CI3]|uniref:transposase n=1 Tax=Paraburkholderia sp. CI3 TaxID=2991060 RepID=UPI003D1EBE9A